MHCTAVRPTHARPGIYRRGKNTELTGQQARPLRKADRVVPSLPARASACVRVWKTTKPACHCWWVGCVGGRPGNYPAAAAAACRRRRCVIGQCREGSFFARVNLPSMRTNAHTTIMGTGAVLACRCVNWGEGAPPSPGEESQRVRECRGSMRRVRMNAGRARSPHPPAEIPAGGTAPGCRGQ